MIEPILGHSVEIHFDHTDEYTYGTIIRIDRRYGKQNGGRDFINPLIYYRNDEGEMKMCDSGFIIRQWKPKQYVDYSPTVRKKIFISYCFHDRLFNLLNKLIDDRRKQNIPSIDINRLIDDMLKQKVINVEFLQSNKKLSKRIEKWVKQNLNRYITSKKDHDRYMTECHLEDEAEIEKMMLEDMEW